MVPLAFPPSADDDVLLKVHVRCRGCLVEAYPLAPVGRPPGGISAKRIFKKQRMFERMAFVCASCGHPASDLVGLAYAQAADIPQSVKEPVVFEAPKSEPEFGPATMPLSKTVVVRRRPLYVTVDELLS